MIAIESENGELVKVLKNMTEGEYGFHRSFGIISKAHADKRIETRKRQCYDYTNDEWLCSFSIQRNEKLLKISALNGCEAIESGKGWELKTPMGVFSISEALGGKISPILEVHPESSKWVSKLLTSLIILGFIGIPMMYFFQKSPAEKTAAAVEEIPEPITVQVKEVKTVHVEPVVMDSSLTPNLVSNSKAAVSRRAVARNLGFLGMIGSKEITNAVGGAPQHLKVATAGAGPGGTGGSGGETLTGLGKGLRRTTVGNTGVQGLGGIGTKGGAGGGLGGYGNTMVASGEGKGGISAIAVSNNDMVLEGGISRYAINATIAKYLNQVRRCYETELKNNPELQGLVEMSFEINASGKLNFSKVNKTTLNNSNVESCISTKMMDWQFPQPKGGVNVSVKYPFMLRPVGV